MQKSRLNRWLNLLATVGVIAGLFLVAFEIRQTNIVAFANLRGDLLSDYQTQAMSNYGPEIGGLFIKSIQEPDQLSDEEIFKVSEYLIAVMSIVNKQAVLYYDFGWAAEPTDDIQDNAQYFLGGSFARAWWLENKYWMHPALVETVEREIAANPVSNKWRYADKIRSHMTKAAYAEGDQ